MTVAQPEAERLLREAVAQSPDDPAVLSALGYVEQTQGAKEKARESYRKALALDPSLIDAATNLGVLEAQVRTTGRGGYSFGRMPSGARQAVAPSAWIWRAHFAALVSSMTPALIRFVCCSSIPILVRRNGCSTNSMPIHQMWPMSYCGSVCLIAQLLGDL